MSDVTMAISADVDTNADVAYLSDVTMAISADADTNADVAYLDHLMTHNSWSRLVITVHTDRYQLLACYDVISAYIPFTFTAKVSW